MSFHMAHLSYGNYIVSEWSDDNMAPCFFFRGLTDLDLECRVWPRLKNILYMANEEYAHKKKHWNYYFS